MHASMFYGYLGNSVNASRRTLFLGVCFHVQNSITSAFDVRQSLKLYHRIQQNQSVNLSSFYDANAFDVKMTLE